MATNQKGKKKLTTQRVCLRTYTRKPSVAEHHAFLTGKEIGGLSPKLMVVTVEKNTSLFELRTHIETTRERGMVRRPILYSEIMHLMRCAENPYNYPAEKSTYEYRLGILAAPKPTVFDVPYVVPKPLEKHVLALSVPLVSSFPTVVVLPVTQVNPKTGQCADFLGKNYCTEFYKKCIDQAKKQAGEAARSDEQVEGEY